jgi:hypothetical protein
MKIYADFIDLETCKGEGDDVCLDLTGYGTLASLSQHQVRLQIGQRLILSDPDGLEVSALVYFWEGRISKRGSGWYAKFRRSEIKNVPSREHNYDVHLCFKCRLNLRQHLDHVGQNYSEHCPRCGTSVMFPLLPP